jgi:hypothetical protein
MKATILLFLSKEILAAILHEIIHAIATSLANELNPLGD